MKVTETHLKGCFIIEPDIFKDDRGYFFESFNADNFNKAMGQKINFVQDNQSYSTMGVVRAFIIKEVNLHRPNWYVFLVDEYVMLR